MNSLIPSLAKLAGCCAFIALITSSETTWAQGSLNSESLRRTQTIDQQRLREVPRRSVRRSTDSGYVDMRWGGSTQNNLRSNISRSNERMCLTEEEVRGQKVESEVILAAPDKALNLIPGGIFDSYQLLQSGEFKYLNWSERKPYSISVNSNLAKRRTATVPSTGLLPPLQGNSRVTQAAAISAVSILTTPSNFTGNPTIKSENTFSESTFKDSLGINIGASFFYLIGSGKTSFEYLASNNKNLLAVSSYQPLVAVMMDSITDPQDLFTHTTEAGPDALLIREVQYGRRIYVIAETQSNSEEIAQSFRASVNALIAGGSIDEDFKKKTFSKLTNIKVITFGGSNSAVTAINSPEALQQAVSQFTTSAYQISDIVPLSYKASDLNGNSVSLVTNAFLNGKNCLRSNKMRISLQSVKVVTANDGDSTEELYGNITINQRDSQGRVLGADGKTPQVAAPGMPALPSATLSVASKDAPKQLEQGIPWTPQQRHVDINVFDLSNRLQIVPNIKEEDNISDDTFVTDDKFNLKLRDMLLEGRTRQTFELRDGGSVVLLDVEITPL